MLSLHWLSLCRETLGFDVIGTSHATSTFKMADVNVHELMTAPTFKSNAGDHKVCKKRIYLDYGADRNIRPSGSLFVITRQSLDGVFYPHLTPMKDSYILHENGYLPII